MDWTELVERAARGDHEAFAALATAAAPRMDAAARLILRDAELARDAVQNALVRAWRDLPTLRDPARFDPWLHRLLVNSCLDEARRRRRRPIEVEISGIEVPAADRDHRSVADQDLIERALARLDPEHRSVVVLHHYFGYTVPDVATILGLSESAARSRLHRAIGSLRRALAPELSDSPQLEGGRIA